MKAMTFIITLLLIISSFTTRAGSSDSLIKKNPLIYQFEIMEEIAPSATRKASKAVDEAIAMNADLIILHLNTYGGLVSDADSIRTRLLNSPIPVYVFIENNAASAGALISIACNRIYMRKGASIGAATVVSGEGKEAPDKYQSYMRSKMRATASARGRNPEIAEAMVDGDKVVQGLNDTGDVVTLTAEEAMKWGYCDGIAESIDEMLSQAHIEGPKIVKQQISWIDQAIGFLISPGVSGVLILIILGGIYYEIRTPGIGFPLLASVIAALLYFAPLYLEGLAENWEILLFIAGLVLLGLEIFVIPGFGIAGISGLVLLFTALVLSTINNNIFDFSPANPEDIRSALLKVVLALFSFFVLIALTGKAMYDAPWLKKLSLQEELPAGGIKAANEILPQNGDRGLAETRLNPRGTIQVHNSYHEAHTFGEFIDKGEEIVIIRKDSNGYLVEKAPIVSKG